MLAIITKMTLTQVSTWFANARRRLKKENKMQWSPNKRADDRDDDDDDDCRDDDDDGDVRGGPPKLQIADDGRPMARGRSFPSSAVDDEDSRQLVDDTSE